MKANRFHFRAWDAEFKKMRDLSQWSISTLIDTPNIIPMQSTGLTDANDVEIFEGDVVEWTDSLGAGAEFCGKDSFVTRVDVEWINAMAGFDMIPFSDSVVIGNIYENPELLKGART